jgi:SAM-dependent methyltransferase
MSMFKELMANGQKVIADIEANKVDAVTKAAMMSVNASINSLRLAELGEASKESFPEQLFVEFKALLASNGLTSGKIGEVGGHKNSFMHRLPEFETTYLSIFPYPDPRYVVADITNCPHIPDNTFDAIFSVSVLEHVTRVHDAAREITRILKPGGVTMHAVPFSYFFHGAPVDYWRMTTSAMEGLFEELDTVEARFYNENRRRDNRGNSANPIDQDGGAMFAVDAFGGWRENWFTIYSGKKPESSRQKLNDRRVLQTAIDLAKSLTEAGLSEDAALDRSMQLLQHVSFDNNGRVMIAREPNAHLIVPFTREALGDMWRVRSKKTVRPSVNRYNLFALVKYAGLHG